MKKFLLVLLFILGILVYAFYSEQTRFKISAPMEDFEYKKNIILTSKHRTYKLENLRNLVGPNELKRIMEENDDNVEIYTPSEKNIKNGVFRANFHMHTTNSDGRAKVEQLFNQAQEYAEKNLNGKPIYIGITDHNTVLGAKEAVAVLQRNPKKYKNIRVITGIEIFTAYKTKFSKRPIDIHVLTLCINPYDEFLNKEFYKKNLKDVWNRTYPDRDFNRVISFMSDYGIVGIAHPARYLEHLGNDKEDYIKELLNSYKNENKNKILFLEGYYQVYHLITPKFDDEFKAFLSFINTEANKLGIYRTGSTDTHGLSIFEK